MTMTLKEYVSGLARAAKKASVSLRTLSADAKNRAILAMARSIDARGEAVRAANARDLAGAGKKGLSAAMLDRLTLTDKRIDDMIGSLREIAVLRGPGGGGDRRPPSVRLPAGEGAHAHRRHRHDLRVPAQRDRGRGGAVPEIGQRGHPARRKRGPGVQQRAGARHPRGAWPPPAWTGTRCSTWSGPSTRPSTSW